eukprot:597107-Prymnesium_polylepis.1
MRSTWSTSAVCNLTSPDPSSLKRLAHGGVSRRDRVARPKRPLALHRLIKTQIVLRDTDHVPNCSRCFGPPGRESSKTKATARPRAELVAAATVQPATGWEVHRSPVRQHRFCAARKSRRMLVHLLLLAALLPVAGGSSSSPSWTPATALSRTSNTILAADPRDVARRLRKEQDDSLAVPGDEGEEPAGAGAATDEGEGEKGGKVRKKTHGEKHG